MAGPARSDSGTKGDDPNALYALGSSRDERARLQRQAEELAAAARRCWIGLACGRARKRLISVAVRAGSWTCWPAGFPGRPGCWPGR